MKISLPLRTIVPVALALALALPVAGPRDLRAQESPAEPWPEDDAVPVPALDRATWYRADQGWIVLDDPRFVHRAGREMRAAAKAYERHFGRPAPKGAVVDVSFADRTEEIEVAGAAWSLAYPFERVRRRGEADDRDGSSGAGRAAAIRSQIEAQLEGSGVEKTEAEIDAMVEKALARPGETREEEIFVEITQALRGGSSMEGWLREHGREHGLPTTVAGLEDALLAWAER